MIGRVGEGGFEGWAFFHRGAACRLHAFGTHIHSAALTDNTPQTHAHHNSNFKHNSYPEAAAAYFLEPLRLASPSYVGLLTGLVALGAVADPLVDRLTSKEVEPQLAALLDPAAPAAAAAAAREAALKATKEAPAAPAAKEEKKEGEEGAGDKAGGEQEGGGSGGGAAAMDVDAGAGAAAGGAEAAAADAAPDADAAAAEAAARAEAAAVHAVQLIDALRAARPDWLPSREALPAALRKRWADPARAERARAAAADAGAPRARALETRWLAEALLACADARRGDPGALLELFDAYAAPAASDLSFLARYASDVAAKAWSLAERRALLALWAERLAAGAVAQRLAAQQLQLLVLPLLQGALDAGEAALLDEKLAGRLLRDALRCTAADEPRGAGAGARGGAAAAAAQQGPGPLAFSEPLRARLCQLATLMLKLNARAVLSDADRRKRLAAWLWRLLKAPPDDAPCRSYAFVAVAQLLQDPSFDFKTCSQAWVAALRHVQPEPRKGLMREALDLLVPRLVAAEAAEAKDGKDGGDKGGASGKGGSKERSGGGDKGAADKAAAAPPPSGPQWAKFAKRTLLEENHASAHLLLMWQMIVRHPDAFYPARALFGHQIINSLSKLALATNSQLENRKLAIDLAALLVRWEERRIAEHIAKWGDDPPSPPPEPAAPAAPAAAGAEGGEGKGEEGGAAAAAAAAAAPAPSPGQKRPREEGEGEGAGAEAKAAAEGEAGAAAEGDGAAKPADGDGEPPAKQAKGPDGEPAAAPAAAPAPPAAPAAPAAPAKSWAAGPKPRAGEHALSPQHADAVLHLLIRVAFVCADAPDREMQALRAHTLKVFRRAAALFKGAQVRLPWLEKLLQNQRDKDPMPAVPTGWAILGAALEAQPRGAPAAAAAQFVQLLGPGFAARQRETVELMAATLRRLFQEYPMDDPRCALI